MEIDLNNPEYNKSEEEKKANFHLRMNESNEVGRVMFDLMLKTDHIGQVVLAQNFIKGLTLQLRNIGYSHEKIKAIVNDSIMTEIPDKLKD